MKRIKLLLILTILLLRHFTYADAGTIYIFSFTYQSKNLYIDISSYGNLRADKSFDFGSVTKKALEVLEEHLKYSPYKIYYQNYFSVNVSKLGFYNDDELIVLTDTIRINFDTINFDKIKFIDVKRGPNVGGSIFTHITLDDKPWIENSTFEVIQNLEISTCHIRFLTSRPLTEIDLSKINNLDENSNIDEVILIANELKSKGLLVLSFCSC